MYTSDELTRTSGAIQAAISGIKQERLESQREDSQVMQEVDFLRGENERLEESVAEIRAMMDYEDQGWKAIFGAANGDKEEGLSLEEVKMISKKARVKVAGASLEKQASDLHGGYVFGQGLEIPGTERETTAENGKKKGRTKGEVRFFEDPINQENLFSDGAHKELQRARFTDGNVIVMCDENTKQVRRIPITEITGYITNPDHNDEIWAWLRTWTQYRNNGNSETKQAWIYTNRVKTSERKKTIQAGGKQVKVLQDVTAVDLRANRQVGWALGVPDATAGMHWTAAYGEVLRYGQIVSENLAKVIFKVVTKDPKTAKGAGFKMKGATPGSAAAMGQGQDIQLVNASQRSFDFTQARPLAAMAASAWNVPNIDLLSDSSAAGSSYGAAAALATGVQNAMRGMQLEWTQFFQEVFVAVGFDRPDINWEPMEKPDAYREAQQLKLYQDGLQPEEYRREVLDRLNIAGDASDIPDTLKSVDTGVTGVQAASPDQGKSNGTGGQDSTQKSDQRTDTISSESVLVQMQMEDMLREMKGMVARIEAAGK